MGALDPLVLDEAALLAAAECADDVFDVPDARHVEQARRFVTAYLRALGKDSMPTDPPAPPRRPSEMVWP